MLENMLTREIGDWVGWAVNVGCIVGDIVGLGVRVPETSVLLPAGTPTDDCQSWYPFIFKMIAWLPCGISTRVSGVRPRYALSRKMLAPDGLDLTVIWPFIMGVGPGETGSRFAWILDTVPAVITTVWV